MNSLDRVPQVPQDYANHFIYGGALGLATFAISYYFYPLHLSLQIATLVPLVLCGVKKYMDYQPPKSESLRMCVGKTIVTALLPLSFLLASYLK